MKIRNLVSTILLLLNLKFFNLNMKKLIISTIIVLSIIYISNSFIKYYNNSIELKTSFKQSLNNRGITFDLMKKQLILSLLKEDSELTAIFVTSRKSSVVI